ncbi:nucleotidyl transferase AbiEii/AbiGii toxin family protein [Propionicicella superfundia]|uniref:nucleotidyl transferase AbiEii/AbiGii toxin family protein n=1 Tax=Propionicicella superfundia TaxID=348582 RepID=UPI000404D8A3|nr:nucleotidyl transferase AbiEii/AbiGii toxin family protein [Propionicicella superfundia]
MPDFGYPDSAGVEAAIKAAAKSAHDADPTRQTGDLIRQAHYDRFLCRVFSGSDASEWVLKGGTGMLARIPTARRTLDADLYRAGYDKDQALADLRRLAELDLGDHFRFVYREHHEILADDTQPYMDGYRVTFDAYLGVKLVDTIKVDLSAGTLPADSLEVEEPANRLRLPRLVSYPYRLYPVTNQIADKVCATITDYGGRPSSREKDLVDLVVMVITQSVDAVSLRQAIASECAKRRLRFPDEFAVPAQWGAAYAKLVRNTPAEPYPITAARELLSNFIDPVLTGGAAGAWHPEIRIWS